MAASPAKKARVDPTASPYKVFFPGEEGSLAHIATARFFSNSPNAQLQGTETFADSFNGINSGAALYAVVPIENSASGCLSQTYDLMGQHDVTIGGELGFRENYCLCSKEGTDTKSVRRVLSHPYIIEACSTFIEKKLDIVTEVAPTRTTTEAARRVANDEKAGGIACICSREAAQKNGLTILASNIGNYTHQETRYIVIHRSRGPAADVPPPFPRDAISPIWKHSAVFVISDEPNSLGKLLSGFAYRNINVLKLEMRPMKGYKAPADRPVSKLWDDMVFVDFAVPTGQSAEVSEKLWSNLCEWSVWRRDFGNYPSQTSRTIKKEEQSWEDMVDMMTKG